MSSGIADDQGMPFETALALLKSGRRVARAGWNGKGMFLFYVKGHEWSLPSVEVVPGKVLPLLPFIAMKTAGDEVVPWLASQTDVLASDWCEVE